MNKHQRQQVIQEVNREIDTVENIKAKLKQGTISSKHSFTVNDLTYDTRFSPLVNLLAHEANIHPKTVYERAETLRRALKVKNPEWRKMQASTRKEREKPETKQPEVKSKRSSKAYDLFMGLCKK